MHCEDMKEKVMRTVIKKTFGLVAVCILIICTTGCGETETPAEEKPREENPQSFGSMQVTRPRIAGKITVSATVNQSIQSYLALTGKLPTSLEALKADGYDLPNAPHGYKYKYDSTTGKCELEWQG